MKIWPHLALLALLISGCATKNIYEIAEGKEPRSLFNLGEIKSAHQRQNSIILDMDLINQKTGKSEQSCFIFPTELWSEKPTAYKTILLTKEIAKECPTYPPQELQQIPIYRHLANPPSAPNNLTQWTVINRQHIIYIKSSELYTTVILKTAKEARKRQRLAYLLYPFTIPLNIITSPNPIYLLHKHVQHRTSPKMARLAWAILNSN